MEKIVYYIDIFVLQLSSPGNNIWILFLIDFDMNIIMQEE